MNDYDIFIVPDFKLDSDYNYDIKIIVDKTLTNEQLINKFKELNIEKDDYFTSYSKVLYYCNVSSLVDIKQWLIQLSDELKILNIRSNLDLLNKAKESKK